LITARNDVKPLARREVEMDGRKGGNDNEDGPGDTKNEWKRQEK
jgi:hypothetical protein